MTPLLIGIGTGILLILWGIAEIVKTNRLCRHGIHTNGSIVKVVKCARGAYKVHIAFVTLDNERVSTSYWANPDYRDVMPGIGESVEIAYMPANPKKIINVSNKSNALLGSMLILTGTVSVIAVASMGFIVHP